MRELPEKLFPRPFMSGSVDSHPLNCVHVRREYVRGGVKIIDVGGRILSGPLRKFVSYLKVSIFVPSSHHLTVSSPTLAWWYR
jgi:hypothetical protein